MSRIFGAVSLRAPALVNSMSVSVRRGYASAHAKVSRLMPNSETEIAVSERQPERFVADSAGVAVVVDGAIYNRNELGRFPSDAHLIADLYRRDGFERLLARLNGDFAIALYDGAAGTLWLARDRFGAKPLYYARTREDFTFASRPAALIGLPGVGTAINRRYAAVFAAAHYRY